MTVQEQQESLSQMTMKYLKKKGCASDGANIITGIHNSLMSRLKLELRRGTVLNCICHSTFICSLHASKCLPRWCQDLVRNICLQNKMAFLSSSC